MGANEKRKNATGISQDRADLLDRKANSARKKFLEEDIDKDHEAFDVSP